MAEEETTQALDQAIKDGIQVVGEGGLVIEEAPHDETVITLKDPAPLDPPKATEDTKEPLPGQEEPPASTPGDQDDETAASLDKEKEEPDSPPDTPDKDFRYKSHADAEKAYKELQAFKTKLERKNLELAAELQKTESDKDFQKKLEESDKGFFEFSKERHSKALAEIDNLDPDSDEYQAKIGAIWAEKDRDIRIFERENQPTRQEPQERVPQSTEEEARSIAMEHVGDMAKGEGLDPDDAFFVSQCQLAPETDETGESLPFDAQVEWAINRTKAYHTQLSKASKAKEEEAAAKRNKQKQEADLPMGRSPAEKTAADDKYVPGSLNDSVEMALNERRL